MRNTIIILLGLLIAPLVCAQQFTESDLPIILIDTEGQSIPDEPKITAMMRVINNAGQVNSIHDKEYEYDGHVGIEMRGNTSQLFFDKKSYTVETRTDSGTNLNVSLLGLPKENDWVLYGPFSDKTMIRNVLAYRLGNSTGRWSPRTRYCEVFLNGEYRGVYVFTEKIKIDNNRVDIATLKPDDISGDQLTGGYILRIDRHREGSWISPFMGRTGSVEVPISYLDPKYKNLTVEQREYIKNYVTDFEYALHGENFKDRYQGYRRYIDVLSFVDYFLISELSRDLDGYRVSVYFHKDKSSKGGKLVMSPLWDYNLGFGNADFFDAEKTDGWVADGLGSGDWYEIPFWWDRLREDPYFETRIKYRWEELRKEKFSQERIFAIIDSCADVLTEAQVRNFTKFKILNEKVWPNYFVGGSYYAEINYLKNWISQRLGWMDSQINNIVPVSVDELSGVLTGSDVVSVYPNPFKELVTVRFKLDSPSEVEIVVQNVLGRQVMHYSNTFTTGVNEFVLDGNEFGHTGTIYIYKILVNGRHIQSGKMIKH